MWCFIWFASETGAGSRAAVNAEKDTQCSLLYSEARVYRRASLGVFKHSERMQLNPVVYCKLRPIVEVDSDVGRR
jgi:hypothetical protein